MAYTNDVLMKRSASSNGRATTKSTKSLARTKQAEQRSKAIEYSTATHKLLLDVSQNQTVGSVKQPAGNLIVENTGLTTATAIAEYKLWTDATSQSANAYHINYLLRPGEAIRIPDVPAVISDETVVNLTGTAVDNEAPNSNEYTDSTADVDDGSGLDVIGSASETKVFLEPYTSATNCTANLFRVKDLIRVQDEIMEVTAIGDKSDLANNYLTVRRGGFGSTAASDHADDAAIRFPFFNAYGDYDTYSVAQTNDRGNFKCRNFFGYGRSATGVGGIVPGSIAIKFYSAGYQTLGLSGITSSTNSGLTAATAYEFDIQVDGGTNFDNLSFTTDSSNVNFGGTNGILSKIQSALDTQYYTSGNLFEKKITVGIVDGDIRFTSGSHLSTSAIALTAGSSGTAEFFGTGRIPAVGSIDAARESILPDDVTYDPLNYIASPNIGVFLYDDGYGSLKGNGTGTINYETGAIDMRGCPPNGEFVFSVIYNGVFAGRASSTVATKVNSLVKLYGSTTNQKLNAELEISRG